MAAYRRVDDLYGHLRLTVCTPGSAAGPKIGIEYGKLPIQQCQNTEGNSDANANQGITYQPHPFLIHQLPSAVKTTASLEILRIL